MNFPEFFKFSQGRRKLLLGLLALFALVGYAFYMKAEYTTFRDGVLGWLAGMLTAHVTQQIKAPSTNTRAQP